MEVKMKKALICKLSVFFIALFALACTAQASPRLYYGFGTGLNFSPDTSNDVQLEFGSEPGFSGLVFFGHDYGSWKYRVEIDARTQNFHGYNTKAGNFTLDGEHLKVHGLSLGLFKKFHNLSLGPVAGYSVLYAFDQDEPAWFVGGEVSYEYHLNDKYSLELGYRYYRWQKISDFGNKGKLAYDTHGPVLRIVIRN